MIIEKIGAQPVDEEGDKLSSLGCMVDVGVPSTWLTFVIVDNGDLVTLLIFLRTYFAAKQITTIIKAVI